MKLKLRFLTFGFLGFSLIATKAPAQKAHGNWPATNWSHSTKNCHHLLSTPAQCKWTFPEIRKPVEGIIIAYNKAQKDDKVLYAASVAIIKSGSNLVRVLLLSNYNDYKVGDHIKVAPDKEPEVDVVVPLDRAYYLAEEKKGGSPQCRINSYDSSVFTTIWGKPVN